MDQLLINLSDPVFWMGAACGAVFIILVLAVLFWSFYLLEENSSDLPVTEPRPSPLTAARPPSAQPTYPRAGRRQNRDRHYFTTARPAEPPTPPTPPSPRRMPRSVS